MTDVTYSALESAEKGSVWANTFEFISDRYLKHAHILDDDFMRKMKNGEFYNRYWELLSCCLLSEVCKLSISKPQIPRAKPKYDFLVVKDGFEFAVENVCIKNADNLDHKIPDNVLGVAKSGIPLDKIQMRIANAISNKKLQYEAILKSGGIDDDTPYVLAIGLYGLAAASIDINLFVTVPQMYLGVFFPIGSPQIVIDISNPSEPTIVPDQSNSSYQASNVKKKMNAPNTDVVVNKDIFTNKDYSFISAVILSNRCDALIGGYGINEGLYNDMIVIHNPLAKNPLPRNSIPAEKEHVANLQGDRWSVPDIIANP